MFCTTVLLLKVMHAVWIPSFPKPNVYFERFLIMEKKVFETPEVIVTVFEESDILTVSLVEGTGDSTRVQW